jgi:hypothetical protein
MPTDPTQPATTGGGQRFRADLDSLPVHKLADLLGELPSSPSGRCSLVCSWGRAERAAAHADKLLLPAGQPGPDKGAPRCGQSSPSTAAPAPPATPGCQH